MTFPKVEKGGWRDGLLVKSFAAAALEGLSSDPSTHIGWLYGHTHTPINHQSYKLERNFTDYGKEAMVSFVVSTLGTCILFALHIKNKFNLGLFLDLQGEAEALIRYSSAVLYHCTSCGQRGVHLSAIIQKLT